MKRFFVQEPSVSIVCCAAIASVSSMNQLLPLPPWYTDDYVRPVLQGRRKFSPSSPPPHASFGNHSL